VRRLRDCLAEQGGTAAILFGLAIVPILAFSGGVVDFARRADLRTEMQTASDSAALAAARVIQQGQLDRDADIEELRAEAEDAARALFLATVTANGGEAPPEPQIVITDSLVRVSADADIPTTFLNVLGIDTLEAVTMSEVGLPEPIIVEIALVLDYSGSMAESDKYIRMTNAATQFIGKVMEDRSDRTKIGIVPFSEFVRAQVPGSVIRDTAAGDANTMMTACLMNRDYPYSAADSTPSTGIAGSRWPAADPAGSECEEHADSGLLVQDLTTDFETLSDALAGMQPTGLTNIALAAEMGWHMLSPNRPFETARDYSDEDLRKVLILLTDGMQTVEALGPGGTSSTLEADEVTGEVCDGMDAAGIQVFTIAYDVSDPHVQDLLANCASSPSTFYDSQTPSGIDGVFEGIFEQIAESVWLSK
jgi:Flp pilus assembly protein TadG